MKLETTLMGINIKNPIIVGSSSLTGTLRNLKKCEEAGAGAVVLKSLYEEQILANSRTATDKDDMYQWYPEAMEYVNKMSLENEIEKHLELVKNCKKEIDIPVIASINCFSANSWVSFAKELENAGADAIELNINIVPNIELQKSSVIEKEYYQILQTVKSIVQIPVAVKMTTYFTNLGMAAKTFDKLGASALVLFNRLYRPDIDIDYLHMTTRDTLSGPEEITQSLRWVGLLSSKLSCDLIASTGIHDAEGVIKQLLAGASAAQVCSTLYENGISFIGEIISDMIAWMTRKGFKDIESFKGYINKDPHNSPSWERIHYMKKSSGSIIKPIVL